MGDVDRIQQLAQSAKLINSYQKVNPADKRQNQKKDQNPQEDRSDVIELTQDESEKEAEIIKIHALEASSDVDDEHLDIAV